MSDDIITFGNEISGQEYVLRPGGYAVVFNQGSKLAVVKTPKGHYLPGGGQDPGESAEGAAVRETFEECGLKIKIEDRIGVADELAFAEDENRYYRKRCTFFTASLLERAGMGEADHRLIWLSKDEMLAKLNQNSQKWAVNEIFKEKP